MEKTIVDYVTDLKFKNAEEKELFIMIAMEYQKGGETYYALTPQELAQVTEIKSADLWQAFLANPSVKAWLDNRMSTVMESLKRKATMRFIGQVNESELSSSDIKNISNVIDANKDKDNGIRLIITRIPEKEDDEAKAIDLLRHEVDLFKYKVLEILDKYRNKCRGNEDLTVLVRELSACVAKELIPTNDTNFISNGFVKFCPK